MELTVEEENGRIVFVPQGAIDEDGADTIKWQFKAAYRHDIKHVVFDFGAVSHIGSAGIGKLMLIYKDLAANQAELKVVNTSPAIFDLLRIVKLDAIFSITKA